MSKKKVCKAIILGDSAVGKTSLLQSYVEQKFANNYKATIGADFLEKQILVDGKMINLVIWDTAGQQKFRSLGQAFYRGSDCCVFIFDITDKKSFQNIQSWMTNFITLGDPRQPERFPYILIGNKIDKHEERQVHQQQIDIFLRAHPKMIYLQTSAKNKEGVQSAFEKIALAADEYRIQQIYQPIGVPSKKLTLDKSKKNQRKTCC